MRKLLCTLLAAFALGILLPETHAAPTSTRAGTTLESGKKHKKPRKHHRKKHRRKPSAKPGARAAKLSSPKS